MSNVGNVDGMANDTVAIIYHCSSTDENPHHQLNPKGGFLNGINTIIGCTQKHKTHTQTRLHQNINQ